MTILWVSFPVFAQTQKSVARLWNEEALKAIQKDYARPPVQARMLFHVSVALYDAWAVYDHEAKPYLLGNTVGAFTCPFNGVNFNGNKLEAQKKAMSYAAYRLLVWRFQYSPNATTTIQSFNQLMWMLGYNIDITSTNYADNDPAKLGNYIASQIIAMGAMDGSNEIYGYIATDYTPVNPPLQVYQQGAPNIVDPNRWQPLKLLNAIDQNGFPIPTTQKFQSPEWGRVIPFSLTPQDQTTYIRNGVPYKVYLDPAPPPRLDTTQITPDSEIFKWGMALVAIWGSHLNPVDTVLWDISPRGMGNNLEYPATHADLSQFYRLTEGGDNSPGRAINPRTGEPYTPNWVKRGDFCRTISEFWADGPNSETPPGHWFSIFNHTMDNPLFVRKFNGQGEELSPLEYDVKAYLTLGGALHDAAITAWSIKGWYDSVRPISAIRYMASKGQSSDPGLPNYHPAGLPLIPGFIELVQPGEQLAEPFDSNAWKVKLYTWRGPNNVDNTQNGTAGVGWILAEDWLPYQRSTFVTPPFAGYVSGHSTFSRSAAEALTFLTGDPYFPGGLGSFTIHAGQFSGIETCPSTTITFQWATYRDAADQTSLSRIWGGIHPPFDDICGRQLGIKIGNRAFNLAKSYFYKDKDGDGLYSFEDCNDNDASVYAGAAEICDDKDNDCNGSIDDNITYYHYFPDVDGDGYGQEYGNPVVSCLETGPAGYVNNNLDCNDANPDVFEGAPELCDYWDNDCDGQVDEDLFQFVYFADFDGDGFGDVQNSVSTCQDSLPPLFVLNGEDCDDSHSTVYPGAPEIPDGLDNDCNGLVDDIMSSSDDAIDLEVAIYPNPFSNQINISRPSSSGFAIRVIAENGATLYQSLIPAQTTVFSVHTSMFPSGIYWVEYTDLIRGETAVKRLVKLGH